MNQPSLFANTLLWRILKTIFFFFLLFVVRLDTMKLPECLRILLFDIAKYMRNGLKCYPTQNLFIVSLLLNILLNIPPSVVYLFFLLLFVFFFFLVKSCGKDYLIREMIFTKNVRFNMILQYWNYMTLMIQTF